MEAFGLKKDSGTDIDATVRKNINHILDGVQKKSNLEFDLIHKIKNYAAKRSAIETEYGQALQSLRQQFNIEERQYKDLGFVNRSFYAAWNNYLNEISNLGVRHANLSQFYSQNIGNNLKNVQANKMEMVKKNSEELKKCVQEFTASSKNTEKYRKLYMEASNAFTAAGFKFARLDKKDSSDSKTKLKLGELEKAIDEARNLYLIRLKATQVHQDWFRGAVLAEIVQNMEDGVYDNLWTYLSAAACVEMENYEASKRVLSDVCEDMQRAPNVDHHKCSFLATQLPAMTDLEFVPCKPDTITSVRRSCANDPTLAAEAKTWVGSRLRSQKTIDDASFKLATAPTLSQTLTKSQPDLRKISSSIETKESLKDTIRRAELNKLKAEAILEMLSDAGVDVDEVMRGRQAESLSSHSSYGSRKSSHVSLQSNTLSEESQVTTPVATTHVKALYDYEPKHHDELPLKAGEVLFIFDDSATNPWPRAKNQWGQVGLVPHNYIASETTIHVESPEEPRPKIESASTTRRVLLPPIIQINNMRKSSTPPLQVSGNENENNVLFYCQAMFDYESSSSEELRFRKGDVIAVVDERPHNGVDDGWWKGRVVIAKGVIHAKSQEHTGTFPSMMVKKTHFTLQEVQEFNPSSLPKVQTDDNVVLRNMKNNVNRRSVKTWYDGGGIGQQLPNDACSKNELYSSCITGRRTAPVATSRFSVNEG